MLGAEAIELFDRGGCHDYQLKANGMKSGERHKGSRDVELIDIDTPVRLSSHRFIPSAITLPLIPNRRR